MKQRYFVGTLIAIAFFVMAGFSGCSVEEETVPEEKDLEVLNPLKGSHLEKTHDIEGIEFVTTYDTGTYDLSRWRVTDSKVVNMTAKAKNVPEGATVLIEHVHIDMSLKSTTPQLDGLTQDSMDDSYHGMSQDGFLVNETYEYQNKFAIEGFSKDLIEGWTFACGSYGSGSISTKILIKYDGEELYHVVSVLDEFLIPVQYESE